MTADDLMRRLHARGHDVPLPVSMPSPKPPERPLEPVEAPRRSVVLFGAPDRMSTDEIAVHHRNGWIAIMPTALARVILRQCPTDVGEDDLAMVLEDALGGPEWHAIFAPMLGEAFGQSFRLFSRIEGALTLHFDNRDEVAVFVSAYLGQELTREN